jgi:hypothetical protein
MVNRLNKTVARGMWSVAKFIKSDDGYRPPAAEPGKRGLIQPGTRDSRCFKEWSSSNFETFDESPW